MYERRRVDTSNVQGVRKLGRYVVFHALAAGGMATVHLGRLMGPVGFARTVAVKRLHENYATDPEFVSMFLDEARLCARIHHPNVVSTIDVISEDGELALVMEYVHGDSLARLLRATKARGEVGIDPKIAASILVGALNGLHAAHEAKSESGEPLAIVHRDVSPQNILIGADGVTRMLDFGIATAAVRLHSTRGGEIKGKFRYMAPEQLRNEELDRRGDIYAAGVVMFEALTGTRYVEAEDPATVVREIMTRSALPPSARKEGIPEALDAVVLRSLAAAREDRFATAEEMALAIEEAVGVTSGAKIGRWVSDLAAKTLADRARYVAEVEASPEGRSSENDLPDVLSGEHPAIPISAELTEPQKMLFPPEPAPRKKTLWIGVAAGAVLLLGGVAFAATRVVPRLLHTAPASTASESGIASIAPSASAPRTAISFSPSPQDSAIPDVPSAAPSASTKPPRTKPDPRKHR